MNEIVPRLIFTARDGAGGHLLVEARIAGVDDFDGLEDGRFGLHVPPPVGLTQGFILPVRSR